MMSLEPSAGKLLRYAYAIQIIADINHKTPAYAALLPLWAHRTVPRVPMHNATQSKWKFIKIDIYILKVKAVPILSKKNLEDYS